MGRLRALLVSLAQIMIVVVIVIGTVGGFVGLGNAGGYGFNIGAAIVGAVVGFIVSSISMSVLAILIDIRQALLRIEAPAPPPAAPAEGLLKARATATTLYLLPDDHDRLRHLATERRVAAQTLLMDALDLLSAQSGQGPVERWETRRKVRG